MISFLVVHPEIYLVKKLENEEIMGTLSYVTTGKWAVYRT